MLAPMGLCGHTHPETRRLTYQSQLASAGLRKGVLQEIVGGINILFLPGTSQRTIDYMLGERTHDFADPDLAARAEGTRGYE